ncbi:MAG: glutamine--fructose-6-phosphate transaminase (isomerizing), partial [Patescibacteria group bacterium]
KSVELFTGSLQDVEKGGFDHFMAKEIFESPDVIRNALRGRVLYRDGSVKLGALDSASNEFAGIQRIVIVSCGTSYYAGLAGKYMLEELTGIPSEVVYASEFRYASFPLMKHALVIAVSQSGETADTLEAVREAKRKGALTLGIVNVVGSSIAREAGRGIYNYAGPEISVASTKAFISQLTIFVLIALWLGRQRHLSLEAGQEILRELQQLPNKAARILSQSPSVAVIAEKYAANNNFLFLGRMYNWPTALEGALKLKEISYVHAEGLAAGEIKHGPIALITEHFPSIVIAPNDSVYKKMISTIREIKARQGTVIAIAAEGNKEIQKIADETFLIPQTIPLLSPILAVIPSQLFAYHTARVRGCDIDKPRNLAKSVTVE